MIENPHLGGFNPKGNGISQLLVVGHLLARHIRKKESLVNYSYSIWNL
jgi:hypothetical protein